MVFWKGIFQKSSTVVIISDYVKELNVPLQNLVTERTFQVGVTQLCDIKNQLRRSVPLGEVHNDDLHGYRQVVLAVFHILVVGKKQF